jgi:hypothetical protein
MTGVSFDWRRSADGVESKARAMTDGFDVNAAYVKALRDEQVGPGNRWSWNLADI